MLRKSKLYFTLAAVAAVMAAVPAASSAYLPPGFEYSAPGTLVGVSPEDQVMTFDGGSLKCHSATGEGRLIELPPLPTVTLGISYSYCAAFGISTVDVTPSRVKFAYNGDGTVSLLNELTITPKIFGFNVCHMTLKPQSNRGVVSYTNQGQDSSVMAAQTVTDLVYESTGGACGPSGSDGKLTGNMLLSRAGGGDFWWIGA